MSSRKSVEEGVKEAVSHFQRIDVLINNAGICRLSTPFTEIKEEDWKETLSVNLYGVIYVTGLVIPYLEKKAGKLSTLLPWPVKSEGLLLLPTMWPARQPCRG